MRFLRLILAVMLTFAFASSNSTSNTTCSPWKGICHVYEDCCRHLICPTYEGRCVPEEGIIVPGQDKRPIGNGPFPPGYPTNSTIP